MYFSVWYGCTAPSVGLSFQNVLWEVCLISYVLDRYWSSSRRLLCVYVFAVCYGCASLYLDASYYVYRYAVLPRVVLCVPVYCGTHCIVPGFRGGVRHLLRGTCSMCTFAVCYGCAALCLDVSYYVYQYTVLPIA